jgi:hypothetical protein
MNGAIPHPRDGTVFISYARADNERPPHSDVVQGWVTFFWDQLRYELTDRGAKRAKLWLDRYDIEPAEAFTPTIERAVAEAKLIVQYFPRTGSKATGAAARWRALPEPTTMPVSVSSRYSRTNRLVSDCLN